MKKRNFVPFFLNGIAAKSSGCSPFSRASGRSFLSVGRDVQTQFFMGHFIRLVTSEVARLYYVLICLIGWFCLVPQCATAQGPEAPQAKVDSSVGESGPFPDALIRDRRWVGLLTQIAAQIEAGQKSDAIELLQRCFDSADDKLLPRGDRRGISLRSAASRLIQEAGKEFWDNYETVQGPEGARLLEQADANGSASGYHEVVRRFAHTMAGFQALDRLANWYFERRDYELAVACWDNLLSNPVHEKRITNTQRLKLLVAAAQCGLSREFQPIADSVNSQTIELGGQPRPAPEWHKRLSNLVEKNAIIAQDWRILGGSNDRARMNSGSVPFLRPEFTLPLFDSQSPGASAIRERNGLDEAKSLLEQELTDRRNAGMAFGFAGTPLVTEDLIVLRDALGVRVLNRRDHKTLWTYRTASSYTVESLGLSEVDSNNLRHSSFLQNSVLCQLSCDDRQIYLIDQLSISDRQQPAYQFEPVEPAPGPDGKPPMFPWNRLVALRFTKQGGQSSPDDNESHVAWKLGGNFYDSTAGPLKGHFFLGPPLPLGHILYTISEFQKQQFFLTALQPENGNVLWSQPLAYVPTPSRESPTLGDRIRLSPASFLAGSRGVLVCPLGAGVLVGLDQITGEILWTYDYRWRPRPKLPQRFQPSVLHNSIEQALEADYPNPPMIHAGRVYFLAPGDTAAPSVDHLHCLDLKTGIKIWHSQCRDARYLALANGEWLLAIGETQVQGISTEDGSVVWTKRVPPVVGIGAVAGANYVLPISGGRVLCLNPRDGSEVGYSLPTEGVQLGNLIVHGRDVISENGSELQIFPQASERLAELQKLPVPQRDQFANQLETAEVQFQLGQLEVAKAHLKQALQLAADETARGAVNLVARELAWRELIQFPAQRQRILQEYAQAAETPEQVAQFLMARGEEEVRQSNWQAAQATSEQMLQLNVDQALKSLGDSERLLTAESWSSALAARIAREAPNHAGALDVQRLAQQASTSGDARRLQAFLIQYPQAPESSRIRLELARKFLDNAQTQAAEFCVWDDHLGNDSSALEACKFLVELWDHGGLHNEAGKLLARIGAELADVQGFDGRPGREFYQSYAPDSLIWSAARRFTPIDWTVKQIKVSELHEVDRQLRGTFNNWPRSLNFPESSHQFFLRGQVAPFYLRQINMETGSIVADFSLPTGNKIYYPHQFLDVRQRAGHFLPSAGSNNCFGVSLLDRSVIWQFPLASSAQPNSVPWIGPASSHACVFRSRNRLLALDPKTGKLLWERSDLDDVPRPLNNLSSIPGNDDVVLLVEPDEEKTYHVYSTLDGAMLREGTLKNCGYIHEHFGPNLLYDIPESPEERRGLRLWDPVNDQTLFEYRVPDNVKTILLSQMSNLTPQPNQDGEFAIAEPNGRVRIVNGRSGKVRLTVELGDRSVRGAPSLKVFSDGIRDYINIQNGAAGMAMPTLYAETMFPTHQITGDLYAIDSKTGNVLWVRRSIPTQSIVQLSEYQLPFLVSLNRTGRANRMNNSIGLRLEVIDGATGQTLAVHTNAINDRLFLMDYDRDLARIRFRGSVTQLQVNFGPEINQHLRPDDEFVGHPAGRVD